MEDTMKKWIVAASLLMSAAFAGHEMNSGEQQAQGSSCQTTDFYGNPTGNLSYYPKQKHFVDPFISAEFTYWQINSLNLGYFRTGLRMSTGVPNSRGKLHLVKPSWQPGFKVALGAVLPHGGWDILTRYTYVNYNNADSASELTSGGSPADSIVVGNGNSVRETAPTSAKAYASTRINIMDLELGRKFFNSRYLALRFFTGLKGIWGPSRARCEFRYSPEAPSTRVAIDGNAVTGPIIVKENGFAWGVGPRLGLETNWYFFRNLSIFARAAISPIYEQIDSHRKIDVFDGQTAINIIDQKDEEKDFINLISEIQLGLEGEAWLYENTYRLAFKLLYEVQEWGGLRPRAAAQLGANATVAHGLTASAAFHF